MNQAAYVDPRDEQEAELCRMWSEVLGLERVGIEDDFFRIGGDSIVSIQLSSKLRRQGFSCQVKDIFDHRTISRLSHYLKYQSESDCIERETEQGLLSGTFDLLPIQQWFFNKKSSGDFKAFNHWNQSFMIVVPELDIERLQDCIALLVSYHDILRVHYIEDTQGNTQQCYLAEIDIPELICLNVKGLSSAEIVSTQTQWQSDFDIENGPLWRMGYIEGYADGSARIYCAFHHLIIDAVSWRIVIEDLQRLYLSSSPSLGLLGDKGSSYRQWVNYIKDYPQTHSQELGYWQAMIEGQVDYAALAVDQKLVPHEAYGMEVKFAKGLTQSLLQTCAQAYHTEINDLLLTALACALKEITGSSLQWITLEGHGRHPGETYDLSHTLGWFTTMYPVKLSVEISLGESIKCIKEQLRGVPNKGIGFGALVCQSDNALSFEGLAPISFNYLGQFDQPGSSDQAKSEKTELSNWQIALDGSGQSMSEANRDTNLININGLVLNGQLQFSVVTRLGERITQQFTAAYQRSLESIIEHCQAQIKIGHVQYTPSDFGLVNISQSLLDDLQQSAQAQGNRIAYIYPANSLQQGFIYQALSQPEDDAYRVQLLFDYHQTLDVKCYVKAWELAIRQYPILRTAFNWEEEIIQVIYEQGKLIYCYQDLSHLDKPFQEQAIDEIQQTDRSKGYDLRKAELLRIYIIKLQSDHYVILKSEHHSIADGWSGPILLKQVHDYYHQLREGDAKKLIVKEDQAYLLSQDYYHRHQKEVQSYWQDQLKGVEQVNDLRVLLDKAGQLKDLDEVRSLAKPEEAILVIEGQLYADVKLLAQRAGITLNTVVQYLWHKLLQVYTQNNQTITGMTTSGRDIAVEGIRGECWVIYQYLAVNY